MRIKALITLAVSANKEILPGQEYDLNEADAKSLIERGFAESVVSKAQPNTQQKNTPQPPANKGKAGSTPVKNNEQTGTQNTSKPQAGGEQTSNEPTGDNPDDTTPDQGDK